jgi:hypothetical protein
VHREMGFLGYLQVSELRLFSMQKRENFNIGSTRKPNILADNGDGDSKRGTSVVTKRHLACYLQVGLKFNVKETACEQTPKNP